MSDHIDDLTAPQGGKSNRKTRKKYVDPTTIPMKEGDILKLNPEYTIAETEWKDIYGNWYEQVTLSAAQLIIARKYKLVVPHDLAIMMANGTDVECKEAIARLRANYANSLLAPFDIGTDEVEAAARLHAKIAPHMPIERVRESAPVAYERYLSFKHGVLWLSKKYK